MATEMTTSVRLSSVSSHFLEEIRQDNRRLRGLRVALRVLSDNRIVLENHVTRLATLLDELRDQLALHFALEEASGYFDDAIDIAPRLFEVAEHLRCEHGELFTTLVGIVEEVADARGKGPARTEGLVEKLHEFDSKLSDHEAQETQLMIEAMERDIGGEG